jgi:hypothetical protein
MHESNLITGSAKTKCSAGLEHMNVRKFLIPFGLLIMLAFAFPAIAMADDAQINVTPTETVAPTDTIPPVDTVTPTGTIAPVETTPPTDTVAPNETPGTDPVDPIGGFFGWRHDMPAEKAANANLTGGIQDNRQEIHRNWWDNLNIWEKIFAHREDVRSDQQLDLANRTANAELRRGILEARLGIREDPANASVYRSEINESRDDIKLNKENISLNHHDIQEERNATQLDRTTIRETRQDDLQIRKENNASRQEVKQNKADIRSDRQQIRSERGNKGSGT